MVKKSAKQKNDGLMLQVYFLTGVIIFSFLALVYNIFNYDPKQSALQLLFICGTYGLISGILSIKTKTYYGFIPLILLTKNTERTSVLHEGKDAIRSGWYHVFYGIVFFILFFSCPQSLNAHLMS